MTLDELLVELGFEYDPKDLEKFKKNLDSTVNAVKQLAKVAVAGATAITGLTIATTRASDEQGKLADEIGESVENIDALQFALARSGGQADSMSQSLRDLSIRASEAARGTGSGVEAFGILGVSVTGVNGGLKSASQLMLEVSGRMQGMSRLQQIEMADKLGLRDSIRLLQQGPDAIRELIAEAKALGVTTEEDARIAQEFQDSLTDIWRVVKQLSRVVVRELAPVMRETAEVMIDWWKANREMIEQNMPKWIDGLTRAIKFLTIAAAAFLAVKLLTTFGSLLALMKKVTVAAMVMNTVAFLLPAVLGAAAVALAGLVEDAKVYFEGGESLIGDWIEQFPKLKTEIETVASVLYGIYNITMMVLDGWSQIFGLFNDQDESFWEKTKEFFKNLPGFLGDVTGLYTVEGGGIIPEAGQAISNTANNVRTGVSNRIDKIEIIIGDTTAAASDVAQEVFNRFQQSSEELNTTVEQ